MQEQREKQPQTAENIIESLNIPDGDKETANYRQFEFKLKRALDSNPEPQILHYINSENNFYVQIKMDGSIASGSYDMVPAGTEDNDSDDVEQVENEKTPKEQALALLNESGIDVETLTRELQFDYFLAKVINGIKFESEHTTHSYNDSSTGTSITVTFDSKGEINVESSQRHEQESKRVT